MRLKKAITHFVSAIVIVASLAVALYPRFAGEPEPYWLMSVGLIIGPVIFAAFMVGQIESDYPVTGSLVSLLGLTGMGYLVVADPSQRMYLVGYILIPVLMLVLANTTWAGRITVIVGTTGIALLASRTGIDLMVIFATIFLFILALVFFGNSRSRDEQASDDETHQPESATEAASGNVMNDSQRQPPPTDGASGAAKLEEQTKTEPFIPDADGPLTDTEGNEREV